MSISIRHQLVRNPFSHRSSTRAEWSTAACKPAQSWGLCTCRLTSHLLCQAQHYSRKVPLVGGGGAARRAGRVREAIQPTLRAFLQNCLVITENAFWFSIYIVIAFIQENLFGFGLTRFELQNKLCNDINQVSLLWEWQPVLPEWDFFVGRLKCQNKQKWCAYSLGASVGQCVFNSPFEGLPTKWCKCKPCQKLLAAERTAWELSACGSVEQIGALSSCSSPAWESSV